ncbi:hypothetical protein D9619_007444 [Psilocybe cf. subviscida]|uniref:DUF6533 domain-containing protein n=1 Tax=Psilocybe cf. subviscida TaxID=2480587 RepID=A0A8H5EWT5_9AGAR|nr:hypothetical protein D9619_007444 [Psilocybe cf. subviscida]
MTQQTPPVFPDIADTVRTNYVGFASFVILIWDHIDTFGDEVELVWKGERKGLSVMHNPNSGIHACSMVFDTSMYVPSGSYPLCAFSGIACIAKLIPFYRFCAALCTLSIWHDRSAAASASAWVPLLYDTIIFGLTLYRTVPPIRREEASYIIKRLLEDGLLYYSVIFTVTFVLTFMIVAAPPGTKNICAQMEQLVIGPTLSRITVAMMSRITLNLKKAGQRLNNNDDCLTMPKTLLFDRRKRQRGSSSQDYFPSFTMPLAASLPPIAISMMPDTSSNRIGGGLVFAHPGSENTTPGTLDERTEPTVRMFVPCTVLPVAHIV